MNTLEYLSFPLKITDVTTEFRYTLKSCGFNKKMIQFLSHKLTWNKNLISNGNKYLAFKYFDSPSTSFLLLTHFWTDLNEKQVFPEWLRLIMSTTKFFKKQTVNDEAINKGVFDRLHNLATKRINSFKTLNTTDNQAIEQAKTPIDDDVNNEISDKAWSSARKEFKNNLKKYIRYVSSWPLHDDEDIFDEYKKWLKESLLIRENSELELEFIEIYRSLENNLASLTNYKMNGKGLPPMILNFGENNQNTNSFSFKTANSVENFKKAEKLWNEDLENYHYDYERALDDFENREFLKKRFEEEMEKELKKQQTEEDKNLVKNEFNTKISKIEFGKYKKKLEDAYQQIIKKVSQKPFFSWPPEIKMPTNDNGVIDRWYAWASQYWMTNVYSNWFLSVGKMARSSADTSTMFRATQIVILDDSSYNISRFGKYALVPLNMPQLIYVYTLRNESPWWRPPQMTWENLSFKTLVEIDVEPIKQEKDRINIIQKRLDNIKESLNQGLMNKKGNVVFYTTSPEFIGYCLFKNIKINIYNTWLKQTPIEIETLREQVLRQSGLLGKMVTRMVPEKTLLLTYIVLMALSCSNGIPMYVGFGWNNVFKQWFGLVKEYQKLVPPSRTNPEETCAWLARMGSTDKSIILNKKLLSPLISRILQSKFAPDKPVTKLNSDYGLWVRKYEELIEEKRISTGRVEPCVVMKMWTPDTHFLYKSIEKITEKEVIDSFERGKREKRKILNKPDVSSDEQKEEIQETETEFQERIESWKNVIKERFELWKKKRERERERLDNIKDEYEEKLFKWEQVQNKNISAMNQLSDKISEIEKELDSTQQDSLISQLEVKQIELNKTVDDLNKLKSDLEKLEKEKASYENKEKTIAERASNWFQNWFDNRSYEISENIKKLTTTQEELQSSIIQLETLINADKINLKTFKEKKIQGENAAIKHAKNKPKDDIDLEKELILWELKNPKPTEENNAATKPKRITMENENKNDSRDSILSFDNINLDDSEPIDLDDLSLDIFSIDTVDELNENKNVDWANRVEWLYTQRQIFQTEYYAPKDLEEILLRFRIRLKDWTGAETITINN